MTVLRFVNARARMHENRHIELAYFFVKWPQHLGVEVAVFMTAHELDALESQLFHGATKLTNRFRHIGKIDPRGADETLVSADIFSHRVVVSARHLDAEIVVDLIDQRPVIGDHDLIVESLTRHDLPVHVKIPARLAERMDLLAIAIIGCRIAGKFFTIANHLAGAFLEFYMAAACVFYPLEKAHRPIMSVAVDIHGNLSVHFPRY